MDFWAIIGPIETHLRPNAHDTHVNNTVLALTTHGGMVKV